LPDLGPVSAPSGGDALVIALLEPRAGAGLVLGRGEKCELALNDATLSQRHLKLSRGAAGWMVEDLGSRNGTFLDEHHVPPHGVLALAPGSRLRAGDVRLTYCSP